MLVAGRITLRGQGDWEHLDYPLPAAGGATADLVRLSPFVEVEVVRWVLVGAGYALTYRSAKGDLVRDVAAFNYTKHEGWLKLTLVY